MNSFLRKLITEWRRLKLPVKDETLVVAISGGADSVSLLLALDELVQLNKLKLRIVAAHFNHKLRGDESDADEDFVHQLTAGRKLELAVGCSRSVATENIEQHARNERYEFLQKTAENLQAFAVVTGHTVNDQAETFLLNLIRGSGMQGLAGMRPIRPMKSTGPDRSEIVLVRPLLTWAHRRDTEAFCHYLAISYRYDTMNEDESFKRVRIRKVLIPLLEDFNPRIIDRLAETAGLLQQDHLESNQSQADKLALSALRKLTQTDLYRTLRAWIEANRGDLRQIELKHIRAIERLVQSEKSGKTAELPGGEAVVKMSGRLTFRKNKVEKQGTGH